MLAILSIIDGLVNIYVLLIIIRALLSWIPISSKYRQAVYLLKNITDPVIIPCQKALPPSKTGGLDLSPIIAIFGITFIWKIILSILL